MARAKSQLTGFSRFLIFLVIAAPLIFFGVSYYKGEDPMKTLTAVFEGNYVPSEQVEEMPAVDEAPTSQTLVNSELAKLRDENAFKEKRITDLYRENEKLKAALKEQQQELQNVQAQLDKIKSAIGQ